MRRRLLPRLGLSALTLVLSLGALEIFLGFHLGDRYYVWPPNFRATFEPAPDATPGIFGTSHVTINALGIRGDPFTRRQQHRLLTIGGSTTISYYLDDSEAWPYLVQERVNKVLGPEVLWVGNVGRSGHATPHHLLQVEKLLQQDPEIDGVILLIGINDFLEHLNRLRNWLVFDDRTMFYTASPASAFSVFPRDDPDLPWRQRTAIGRLLTTVDWPFLGSSRDSAGQDRTGRIVILARQFRRQASTILPFLPDLAGALQNYAFNIHAIIDAVEERGARVIFLTQPALWREGLSDAERDLLWMGGPPMRTMGRGQPYYSIEALAEGMAIYNDTLLRICRERGVECLDAAAALSKDTRIFWDDAHMTEAGASELADLVAAYLLETPPLAELRSAGVP
ncbi:MAG: SGNH/GDSL hydrolase family protein [Myxococcota bacterium]